jgi:hypothetical protein
MKEKIMTANTLGAERPPAMGGQKTMRSRAWRWLAIAVTGLCIVTSGPTAAAATYYVDFAGGANTADGLSPETAWKHSPGDNNATANPKTVALAPGDTIIFKGGVIYRGAVTVKVSGEAGKPIVFDGNSDGAWGNGKAVIDGGVPITDWKRCASAAEAKGNARWADIFYVDVPRPKSYKDMNLCDATMALPISQQPNPKDPFWQEDVSTYQIATGVIVSACTTSLAVESGTHDDKTLPLSGLLLGNPAVISPVPGAGFTYTLEQAQTVVAVGLAAQPQYAALKEVVVLGDGKELLRLDLAKDGKGTLQRFELPAPATVTTLTFRFISLHTPGGKDNWSKLKQVAAFTKEGVNLLKGSDTMTFTDKAYLNQPEANWYDGMTFAFWEGNNGVLELPIKGYDPATGTLRLPVFSRPQYKQTKYCLFNSVRFIDQSGEYSVENNADGRISRIFLLPPQVADGQPVDISVSVQKFGFELNGASHVVVQGFLVRRQAGRALSAQGPAGGRSSGVVFRDCEVTLVRGDFAVSGNHVDDLLVERCNVHDNPGHTKGVAIHTCTKAIVRDCRVVRTTSTAVIFYLSTDCQVIGNTVLENYGMHANGLSFYTQCRNILVERNRVAHGNIALTIQDSNDLIIRNNLLDGSGKAMVASMWTGPTIKNVQFLNNTMVRSYRDLGFTVGLFTNCKDVEGLVVRNNIIDGVGDDRKGVFAKGGVFSNNLYTRVNDQLQDPKLGTDCLQELDLKRIFVDPEHDDFRLCARSPAIGAGMEVGVATDIEGKIRPTTRRPDVGAWAYPEGQ